MIDPETNLDVVADIAISRGSVTEIGDDLSHEATTSIDARGLVVTAGFIDLHSHSDSIAGLRLQATDGVTTALELEAGVAPRKPRLSTCGGRGKADQLRVLRFMGAGEDVSARWP